MMDRISAYRELIRKNIEYENYPPIYHERGSVSGIWKR